MKKLVVLLVLLISTVSYGQLKRFNGRVEIKNTPAAVATDTLVAINAAGEVRNAGIAVGDVGSGGGSTEWANSTGTRAGADLVVEIGDYDDSANGVSMTIDDASEVITFSNRDEVQVGGAPQPEASGLGDRSFAVSQSQGFPLPVTTTQFEVYEGGVIKAPQVSADDIDTAGKQALLTLDYLQKRRSLRDTLVTVTAAELATISTNQKVLISAQGSGKVITTIDITGYIDNQGTAYDFADNLEIEYDADATEFAVVASNRVNSATDIYFAVDKSGASAKIRYDDDAVVLTCASNPTVGNGDLYLMICYTIQDFN